MVLLSHSYVTTGKTIALTRRTFVGKVVSLLSSWAVLTAFPIVGPDIGKQEPGRPSSANMVPAADRLDCGCMGRWGGSQSQIKSPEALSIVMTIVQSLVPASGIDSSKQKRRVGKSTQF